VPARALTGQRRSKSGFGSLPVHLLDERARRLRERVTAARELRCHGSGPRARAPRCPSGATAWRGRPETSPRLLVRERCPALCAFSSERTAPSRPRADGLVSGGRAKPWRQKGTGRAAPAGTEPLQRSVSRAGGHAFAKTPRTSRPEGEPEGCQSRSSIGVGPVMRERALSPSWMPRRSKSRQRN